MSPVPAPQVPEPEPLDEATQRIILGLLEVGGRVQRVRETVVARARLESNPSPPDGMVVCPNRSGA